MVMSIQLVKRTFMLLLLLLTTGVLTGCVGTVEEGSPNETEYYEPKKYSFYYPGITAARAISHDKIEIDFFPTFGREKYTYYLYVNGNDPVELNLEALDDAGGGKLMYTMKDLNINQTYKLKITAEEIETGDVSSGEAEYYISTFDNRTARFAGINTVEKVVGQSDTQVNVYWVAPDMDGTFAAENYDPVYYEVTYISEIGGYKNLNNPDYGGTDRQTVRVPPSGVASPGFNPSEVKITNLQPDTRYYFQVRAINKLWNDMYNANPDEIPVDKEVNTRFTSVKMDGSTSLFDFNRNSLVLQNAPGAEAYSKFFAFWEYGEGTFHGYRIFIHKYTGSDDATIDDQLTDVKMQEIIDNNWTSGDSYYADMEPTETSFTASSLSEFNWYQVKVALCKTIACPLDPADPNAAIISNPQAIFTDAVLAPFGGINFIGNPEDASTIDQIKLSTDTPTLSVGHAEEMHLYCLDPVNFDPTNPSTYVQFPSTPFAAISSSITHCDGLMYTETLDLNTTVLPIRGVKNVNTDGLDDAHYCFAMAPAITTKGAYNKSMDPSDWVVRCIHPEIKVPNINEFPGITSTCTINQNQVTVGWEAPLGGIYNQYRVFWYQKPAGTDSFNFADAIADANGAAGDYNDSGFLSDSTFTYTMNNLRPGKRYQIGVLTVAYDAATTPVTELYSEHNLNVLDCDIPLPKASFDEWTRIFAIGPKVNGLFPKENPYDEYKPEALIYEALNTDAIPLEVKVDTSLKTPVDDDWFDQPGNYTTPPASYNEITKADANPNEDGYLASKEGIISLAFKKVTLEFLQGEFDSNNDVSDDRAGRTYGYRIYRSDDNRLSWKEVTQNGGLLHQAPYTWRKRRNSGDETDDMIFFTDYSVKYTPSNNTVSKARTYWYRVVPVFDDMELPWDDETSFSPAHMVKVVLPPPNMALVHRMMANRTMCNEMGLPLNKGLGEHYSCDYNGMGSRSKTTPWALGQTVYDQKGDLLVDRFELGCNFTRGNSYYLKEESKSYFDKPNANWQPGIKSDMSLFKGHNTDALGNDDTSRFMGCTLGTRQHNTLEASNHYDPNNYDGNFEKMIYGDCVDEGSVSIPWKESTNALYGCGGYPTNYPGTRNFYNGAVVEPFDCTANTDPDKPQVAYSETADNLSYFGKENIRHLTVQAEHMAVLFKKNNYGRPISPWGPGDTKIMNTLGDYQYRSNCMINLASIGASDEWRSRWVPVNHLFNLKSNTTSETPMVRSVGDVTTDTALYDSTDYKAPAAQFYDDKRYDNDTPIGRIFSSNSAKLPPLTAIRKGDAQKLCGLYQVQVGYGDDDGNFFSVELPKGKRLARRSELIAMSAWPDNWDDVKTQEVEWGTAPGAQSAPNCNTQGSIEWETSIGHSISQSPSSPFPNRFAIDSKGVPMPLMSGSSVYLNTLGDWSNSHSQECVSKYGIQDLVGNLRDMSSDKMYCDYSLDKFYFGKHSGNPYNDGATGGDISQSVEYELPRSSFWTILNNTEISFEDSDDPTRPSITGNKYWPAVNPDSGYCSLVDSDPDVYDNALRFRDVSGIFEEVYNPDGSLNISMVQKDNVLDQKAINTARDGDGFYLNMGRSHLMPNIGDTGSLALDTSSGGVGTGASVAIGKYFNPVLGLPIYCGTETSNCSLSADNRRITTGFFTANNGVTGTDIANFPTLKSQVFNNGLSEYEWNTTNYEFTYSLSQADQFNSGNRVAVTKFKITGDADDLSTYTIETKPFSQLYAEMGETNVQMMRMRWTIPRGSPLFFLNMGYFNSNTAGRYDTIFTWSNDIWDTGRDDMGVRCMVMVNEED
jgi:hypothetical protein